MDSEEEKEKEVTSSYEVKEIQPKRVINWRKIGLGFLFFLATVAALALGYLAVFLWQYYFPGSFLTGPNPYENWQVYRSETYLLGLRYPENWEITEVSKDLMVFRPVAVEGQTSPKDYVSLRVSSNKNRAQTACEKDQSACSFLVNDIYGERILTPESETIFFSKGKNDFSLTWSKYGEADFAAIFEEMGKSLRFTAPENTDVQNP